MEINTLHTFDTEYSADSVEWCPHDGYHMYFACGTYQVIEEIGRDAIDSSSPKTKRKGRLYLFRFQPDEDDEQTTTLLEMQRIETTAILDMKWMPDGGIGKSVPFLAIATAQGCIEIYALKMNMNENTGSSMQLIRKSSLVLHSKTEMENDKNFLILSLDWCGDTIIASNSMGGITLLESHFIGDGEDTVELKEICTWQAHGFEAWTCAFDKWNLNRVFSGGDDMLLLAHDRRTQEKIMTNRSHLAGVTCLLSHPKHEHLFITGSYDEHIRLFDGRSMKRPLFELSLGGGIWRLKPDPIKGGDFILTACMYKNFSVVELLGDAKDGISVSVKASYNEHDSICYGADWSPSMAFDKVHGYWHMATCSFYDHKLCVARMQIKNESDENKH